MLRIVGLSAITCAAARLQALLGRIANFVLDKTCVSKYCCKHRKLEKPPYFVLASNCILFIVYRPTDNAPARPPRLYTVPRVDQRVGQRDLIIKQ